MFLDDSERNRSRGTSIDRVTEPTREHISDWRIWVNGARVGILCIVLTAFLKQQSMCVATDKQGLPAAPCTSVEPGLALAGSMGSEESKEVKVDSWG